MRVALVTACSLLWATVAVAQQQDVTLRIGDARTAVADQPTTAHTTGYALSVNGMQSVARTVAQAWSNGAIYLPFRIVALGEGQQAPSDAIVVAIEALPKPAPAPCQDYVTAAGVPSPKALGESFIGSVSWKQNDVASQYAAAARMRQLQAWGLSYFETERTNTLTRGVFTCVGVPG